MIGKSAGNQFGRGDVRINHLAIQEGYEDLEKLCQETTVVETNIKYPTNNPLVWDCIHESHRLLSHLKKEMEDLSFIDYIRQAKRLTTRST